MSMQVRVAIGAGVLALLGADMSGAQAGATVERRAPTTRASLCGRGETVLFQCHMPGGKMAAVCGGRSGGQAVAQYRYGRPGAVELSYPAAGAGGGGTMVRSLVPYSGGGEAQIHFTTAGHDYVVYSRVLRTRFDSSGRNDAAFSAGVAVRQGGRILSNRACTDGERAQVDLAAAEPFMPEGEPIPLDD